MNKFKYLFSLGEDSCSDQDIIRDIEQGVNFRGAKLWILIIAIFVASLGLNTNSAAVIIGAMLISPLMGPIIGMGLGVGIYDFELTRRSFRNYIVATLFSILTATIYFLLSPFKETQSELLARTSPTIYDVLIALCGGLAGIIALSSRSQRTGNVIPGVAIATALMPPLCTVGFGLATANWAYAAGALYLFIINTIFIAFATLMGARFIMKLKPKNYLDAAVEKRVKRYLYGLVVITMVPAMVLTVGMLRRNYFEQQVRQFIRQEMNFPTAQVISHSTDFDAKAFSVVLIGQEQDSASLQEVKQRLSFYHLENAEMRVIQGRQEDVDEKVQKLLQADNKELRHAEGVIAQQQTQIKELEKQLMDYEETGKLTGSLLREVKVLFPQVQEVTMAKGMTTVADSAMSTHTQYVALVFLESRLAARDQERLVNWMRERTGRQEVKVLVTEAGN